MVIKTKYTAKDYNADIVEENIKRFSRGEPIIEEGSPEYENIMKRLKNEAAAKRIVGVFVMQGIIGDYENGGKLVPDRQAIEPVSRKTKNREDVAYV